MLMRTNVVLGSLVVVFGGCTVVASDDTDPFSTANPVTSMTPATDTDEGDTEASGSSGSGGESSGGDTTGDGSATTTGPMDTTGASMGDSSGSSSGGGGNGMQPDMGQYSPCTIPEDCGFSPELCLTVRGAGGFCTTSGCGAAADCDPSPVATATTACVPTKVDGVPDMICVLQCTGGTACPTPMACTNVTGFGEICV